MSFFFAVENRSKVQIAQQVGDADIKWSVIAEESVLLAMGE